MNLHEAHFGTDEEQQVEDRERQELVDESTADQADWFEHPYTPKFIAALDKLVERYEPQPGAHADMLYNAGTRNGLLMIRQHIRGIEQAIKEKKDV